MRPFLILLALLVPSRPLLGDVPIWRSSDVKVSLLSDGALSVIENGSVFVPEGVSVIKRQYWTDADERVTPIRVMRIESNGTEVPERFVSPWPGFVQWNATSGGPPQHEYRIESRVTGVVTPIWGLCCPVRQRATLTSPIDRLRETIEVWHDIGPHPTSRYLLDYQFFLSEEQEEVALQPTFAFGPEWKPVHPIASDNIASMVKAEPFGVPASFRIRHVFDYAGAGRPTQVDVRTAMIRDLSIAAFHVVALLIWFSYLRRFALTRPKISEIDERWLREHLINEHPEVIAARWTGRPGVASIERFLRRMERDGKVALEIRTVNEGTDDEDFAVNVRLRVPREKLTEYERIVIDDLIPKGDEIDSRDIRAEKHFDPMARAQKWLYALAHDKPEKSSRLSRAFSFALFAIGACLIATEVPRQNTEPIPLLPVLLLALLAALWPSKATWRLTRRKAIGGLLLFIPMLLMFGLIVLMHTSFAQLLGIYGSVGILLACAGTFHAMVADATKMGKGTSVQRFLELAAAEEWMRRELRVSHPRTKKEWQPYLEAFGLAPPSKKEDEDWGWALTK